MGKKKLCLVIPSLQAGGMERVMSELAHYFAAREEIEVHLVLYGITREIFYPIPDNILISIPRFRFNNKWRLWCTIKTICFLRNEIKRIKPYSILSFGEYWNSFVLIALFRLRFPVFVSDRCQPDKNLGRIHGLLRKILYPLSAGIIAQTEKAAEIYGEIGLNRNIAVIGNPIRQIAERPGIKREKIVLTVGRLINTKHHDKLIELFLSLSDLEWRLVIVGYDHLKQKNSKCLQSIITEHNAETRVILAGKQDDVDAYYLRSGIFAFTSSSEGFPNVIGEAMAAGLPVVAFDCVAGPSEMIEDKKNGFLVPLFDYVLFRERLSVLMEDSELRTAFGKAAKRDIFKYSVDNIGKKYLKFIGLHSDC